MEISTGPTGAKYDTYRDCHGIGNINIPTRQPRIRGRPGADEPEEHERLGVVIFLILAGLGSLKLGVLIGLGKGITELPIWYYPASIGVVGLIAYRFRGVAAMLAWLVVALALLLVVVLFVASIIF